MQGVQFMNQSTNSQINLQQYNNDTYVVEKSTKEKIANNQINVQNYGKQCNCGVKIEKKCCCPIGCPEMRKDMEIVSPECFEKCMKMKKK